MAIPLLSLLLAVYSHLIAASKALKNDQQHDFQERATPPLLSTPQLSQSPSDIDALFAGNSLSDQLFSEILSGNDSNFNDSFTVDTPDNTMTIACNSALFGGGLDAQSCFNALHYCPTGNRQDAWAFPETLAPGASVDVRMPITRLSG